MQAFAANPGPLFSAVFRGVARVGLATPSKLGIPPAQGPALTKPLGML